MRWEKSLSSSVVYQYLSQQSGGPCNAVVIPWKRCIIARVHGWPSDQMFWQLTKQTMERNADKQAEYLYRIGLLYQPGQLVFMDESSCDRRTTYWNKAWAIYGQRAFWKAFFVQGQWYCFIISYLPTGNSFHIDTLFFLPSHSMAFSVLISLKVPSIKIHLHNSSMAYLTEWIHFLQKTQWSWWITVGSIMLISSWKW